MQNYCMNCMMPLDEQNQACPHCGYAGDGSVIAHQLRPGTLLGGRYLVGKAIGQGGFGITYIGRDTRLDMKIAVKEYYPTGYANRNTLVSPDITITDKNQLHFIEEGKKKFLQEARTLALFNENTSVVNVQDFFEANKTAYIIMEYLNGEDLQRCLKRSLFTADQIFALMAPIFDALEKIHGENLIHRDISPDNIMMLNNGTLKLMDFGATRQVNFSDQKSVSVVLKAGFAPEEQYRSKGKQGSWTDIYALCATIYKCITGITPDDSLQRSSKDEIRWPSELGIPITARQEAVLKKGLAVKQKNRFQNIGEMKAALSEELDSPVQSIDLYTDDESDTDRTVYHPHDGPKNTDEDDATQYHPHDSRGKEQSTDEDDATQYHPHIKWGKEPPAADEGAAEDEAGHGQPELEKDSETNVSGSKAKHKFMIAGICAAAILVFVIVAAALRGGSSTAQNPNPTGVLGTDVTDAVDKMAEPSQDPDSVSEHSSMYHVILTIDDKVTVREFNEALPVLTERLDVFTGGASYEMTVADDFIDLYLPKEAFGETEAESALKCYVSGAANLYIFDETDIFVKYLAIETEALSRNDLESVTLMEGMPDGVDAAQYRSDTPNNQYIEVTLTDQCAQQYSQEIAEWGENLAFGLDIAGGSSNFMGVSFSYYSAFPAGDGKTFYLINDDFPELTLYNLSHAPLPFSFTATIDLSSMVQWQSLEETLIPGENQCEVSGLTGDAVTILFRCNNKGLTTGQLLDLETEMKARLDILEQPYSYGEVEDTDYLTVAVKTGLEHMGDSVMELIGYSSGVLYLQSNLVETPISGESLSWEKDESGTYRVTVKVGEYDTDELSKLSGWIADQGGGTLSLTCGMYGSMPLFSTGIDQRIEDGTVIFRYLCFDSDHDGPNITDEDVWFLLLLDRVWNHSQSTIGFSVNGEQMNLAGTVTEPDQNSYGVSYVGEAEAITNAVLSAAPDAVVNIENNGINVALGLEVNEDLPAAATAAAQEIYEASGFGTSIYRSLNIFLINEVDMERGRISFSKNYNWVPTGDESITDGYIYVGGGFVNGRLERYKEAFKNIVETDLFYTDLTVENRTKWTFDT